MRTPLYPAHLRHKAKIVDFHGWDMPISYGGIIEEHTTVRKHAGLFDLSHMGRFSVKGPDREAYLQSLVTVDLKATQNGRAKYTFFLNERGGILDDVIVYKDATELFIVVNAGNREKILGWMNSHKGRHAVTIEDQSAALALLAIQGPASVKAVEAILSLAVEPIPYYGFQRFDILGTSTMVARTGYTGEDGFELFARADHAEKLWTMLIEKGEKFKIAPIGLGARDTLRLEAGMPLYGQEIDETLNPIEAGLSFALSFNKGPYPGLEALQKIKADGVTKKRVGFVGFSKRIPRTHFDVTKGSEKAGWVTSGTFSPTFQKSLGMAYVAAPYAEKGTRLELDIRGKKEDIEIVPLPFYKRPK